MTEPKHVTMARSMSKTMAAKSATKSVPLTPTTLVVDDTEFANFQSDVNDRLAKAYDKGELLHDAIDGHTKEIAAIDDKLTLHSKYFTQVADGMNTLSASQHTLQGEVSAVKGGLATQAGVNKDVIDRVNAMGLQVEGLTASNKRLPDFLMMTAAGSAVVTLLILFIVNSMGPKPTTQKSTVQPQAQQIQVGVKK